MGQPPFRAFTQNGASVFIDAMAPTVGDVLPVSYTHLACNTMPGGIRAVF